MTLRRIQVSQPARPFFKTGRTERMKTWKNLGLVEEVLTNRTSKFLFDFLPVARHFTMQCACVSAKNSLSLSTVVLNSRDW